MKSDTIVAYTYNAAMLCPDCITSMFNNTLNASGGAEHVLDAAAVDFGIDRQDERSFDSGDFPKVVFADQVEDEREFCDGCGEALL